MEIMIVFGKYGWRRNVERLNFCFAGIVEKI